MLPVVRGELSGAPISGFKSCIPVTPHKEVVALRFASVFKACQVVIDLSALLGFVRVVYTDHMHFTRLIFVRGHVMHNVGDVPMQVARNACTANGAGFANTLVDGYHNTSFAR